MVHGKHSDKAKKKISESMKQYWKNKKESNHDSKTIEESNQRTEPEENNGSDQSGEGYTENKTLEFTGGKKPMSESNNESAETFICGECGFEMKSRLPRCPNCGIEFEG